MGPSPHMPSRFLLMCEFIMDQLEHFLRIKTEPPLTDHISCTCHLTDADYCGCKYDMMDKYTIGYVMIIDKNLLQYACWSCKFMLTIFILYYSNWWERLNILYQNGFYQCLKYMFILFYATTFILESQDWQVSTWNL